MNWEAVGAVADLVGVVATLGYLAVQIRQNTISTRTSSYQAVVEALSDWSRSVGFDPAVAKLLDRRSRVGGLVAAHAPELGGAGCARVVRRHGAW